MDRREFLSGSAHALVAGATCGVVGCGTVLYPERHGRPHSRDVDWKVVALDGLCLVFFFVPGVIAFVVDFATGSIYLPPEPCPPDVPLEAYPPSPNLDRIDVPPAELDGPTLEATVEEHTGMRVSLRGGKSRVSPLASVDRFAEQYRRHGREREFGADAGEFLDRLTA